MKSGVCYLKVFSKGARPPFFRWGWEGGVKKKEKKKKKSNPTPFAA